MLVLFEPPHVPETRSEFEPAVSTSGRHIAFVQNRGNLSLALVIEDLSKTLVGEVPPGGGFCGMHSPAFTSNRDGNYGIYVKKLDGSGLLRLTNNAEQDDFPVWDP